MNPNETSQQFDVILEHADKAPYLVVDAESNGRDLRCPKLGGVVQGLAIGYDMGGPVGDYYSLNHKVSGYNLPGEYRLKLKKVIESHPKVVMHNMKFDLRACEELDIHIPLEHAYCTMLMQHWVDENVMSKELDYLLKFHNLGAKVDNKVMAAVKKTGMWGDISGHVMREYATGDVFGESELFRLLEPQFLEQGFSDPWKIEQEFHGLIMDMETNGVLIDPDFCQEELEIGQARMAEIIKFLGKNPGSNKQLKELLIDEMGLPVVKRTKPTTRHPEGQPSFDKEAMAVYDAILERRSDARSQLIKEYRGWSTACGLAYKPYLELVHPDGRLRTDFALHGTVTGRMSARKPNLQQIPKSGKYRWNGHLKGHAFIPEEGYELWEFDYSQLEMRLGAAYSGQQNLLDIFADDERDLFTEMSAEVSMVRNDAKTLNYAIGYSAGVKRIKHLFGVSEEEARKIINRYWTAYPKLQYWNQKTEAAAKARGYIVYWTGRRRHFGRNNREYRKAWNSLIQGGGFEIVKHSMLRVKRAGLLNRPNECRLVLQIHDSIGAEIRKDKVNEYVPEIKRVMEDVQGDFGVRFKVDAHKWGG